MVDQKFLANDPGEVGINRENLAELLDRVRKEVDQGLLPSVQIAIAREGKLAAFETYGDAPEEALYSVFSVTKAITSAAAWLLIQDGKLDVKQKVTSVIPEFANNGKDEVVIEQLFTHTAGFPSAPFRPLLWHDRQARCQRFADWRLNWAPGSRYEYHPTSSMWIIAEIIERLSGQDFSAFIRERIALPLGLEDMWVGIPADQHHRIAPIVHVGDAFTSNDYAQLGITEPAASEVTEESISQFNLSEVRQVPIPGGGGIMSAAEIALFYQALVNGGKSLDGPQIWDQGTIDSALEVRTGDLKDALSGHLVNRALGLVISGDKTRNYRGFGHTNSSLAFGHGGLGGQLAWADPATGISIGYCTNGIDRHPLRQGRRSISISNRAAVCATW